MFNLKKPIRFFLPALLFCLPLWLSAQKKITGTITNANKAPVAEASVSIKGTSIGTTTGTNGQFTINANEGQTLVISSVGYLTTEVLL
jgi:TonB-dependent starch-binding outer membrane protein SusC